MFKHIDTERVESSIDEPTSHLTPAQTVTADLPDQDLEMVTAGMVKSPGGVGGPFSGLGVRPGLGVGAPGLGWRRGPG